MISYPYHYPCKSTQVNSHFFLLSNLPLLPWKWNESKSSNVLIKDMYSAHALLLVEIHIHKVERRYIAKQLQSCANLVIGNIVKHSLPLRFYSFTIHMIHTSSELKYLCICHSAVYRSQHSVYCTLSNFLFVYSFNGIVLCWMHTTLLSILYTYLFLFVCLCKTIRV